MGAEQKVGGLLVATCFALGKATATHPHFFIENSCEQMRLAGCCLFCQRKATYSPTLTELAARLQRNIKLGQKLVPSPAVLFLLLLPHMKSAFPKHWSWLLFVCTTFSFLVFLCCDENR